MRLAPKTIAGRLLLSACLFVTGALLVAGIVLALILHRVVSDQVDQRLQAQGRALAAALAVDAEGRVSIAPGLDAPPFDRRGSGWYWQIETGADVLRSRSLGDGTLKMPPQPFDWRRLFSERQAAVGARDARGRSLHVIGLVSQVGNVAVTIRVSAPRSAILDPLKQALLWLVPSIGGLGLALIGATLLQIGFGLRPLRLLHDALRDVRSGTQSRIPSAQPAELVPVVAELNALIGENEERLASARMNLANMAHGLKTPLASLSLAVRDSDPTGALAGLIDRIETRIRHHLGRARADSGAGMRGYRTDVAAHLADIAGVMQKIYRERHIALTLSVVPGVFVACEQQDFDELAGNLIDNAFKWAGSRVAISAEKTAGQVTIVIEDDGPGIPAEALQTVLRPGQRLDETVPGHGFGLPVSQELVSLYGGSLRLAPSAHGGLTATVELPSA